MAKKQVALLLQPPAAIRTLTQADLTKDISNELNLLVPSVTITPPPGWQPGQPRDAQDRTADAGR